MERYVFLLNVVPICFICHHNLVLFSFMTYHWVCNRGNTMGATSGAETAYTSEALMFIPSFQWGSCCSIFGFLYCFIYIQVTVSVFVFILLAIVLSALLLFRDSYYMGIRTSRDLDISVLEISVLNNKNNLIEFKNFKKIFFYMQTLFMQIFMCFFLIIFN